MMQHKTFSTRKAGDWLIVNTPTVDRDGDRVFPTGANLTNFQKNPVLLWGHNYRDPWAVIGRPADLKVTPSDIRLKPELRKPANEADPMNVIRALWDGGLINSASIGFKPMRSEENEFGGNDITDWELLEVSLVPIPANQDALRLAAKAMSSRPANLTPRQEAKLITVLEQWLVSMQAEVYTMLYTSSLDRFLKATRQAVR